MKTSQNRRKWNNMQRSYDFSCITQKSMLAIYNKYQYTTYQVDLFYIKQPLEFKALAW